MAPASVTVSTCESAVDVPARPTLSCGVYVVLVAAGVQWDTGPAHCTWKLEAGARGSWLGAAVQAGESA